MNIIKKIKLDEFLKIHPSMSLQPSSNNELILRGKFNFVAQHEDFPKIDKSYNLQIKISYNFPFDIPVVSELDGKIPNDKNHHVNPDKTLCLGSQIRLLGLLHKKPTLEGFVGYCLIPFLYAVTLKIEHNVDFIFGELAHGDDGIVSDYEKIFGVSGKEEVNDVLKVLSLRKRIANKKPCPCRCGKRLGKCSFRFKINKYRKLAPKSWYKKIIF